MFTNTRTFQSQFGKFEPKLEQKGTRKGNKHFIPLHAVSVACGTGCSKGLVLFLKYKTVAITCLMKQGKFELQFYDHYLYYQRHPRGLYE